MATINRKRGSDDGFSPLHQEGLHGDIISLHSTFQSCLRFWTSGPVCVAIVTMCDLRLPMKNHLVEKSTIILKLFMSKM